MTSYELDGRQISDLSTFYDEFELQVLRGTSWGRNLDALVDVLRGDFGPIPSKFRIVWRHSETSRIALGYAETACEFTKRSSDAKWSSGRERFAKRAADAMEGMGPTLFDDLVEMLRESEAVELVLA